MTAHFDADASNGTTYVTVQNITGEGILISITADGQLNELTVKLTIDGGAAITKLLTRPDDDLRSFSMAMYQGFATSMKVEMKLGAARSARYSAYSVEFP